MNSDNQPSDESEIDWEVSHKVNDQLNKQQREFYLW